MFYGGGKIVSEDSANEDTDYQYIFNLFVKGYENEIYEGTSIGKYREDVKTIAEKASGRRVDITIYTRETYKATRENELVGKKEASRSIECYIGDEQNRDGNLAKNSQIISYSDGDNVFLYKKIGEKRVL